MRVLLLNPPFFKSYSRSQRSPGVTKSGTVYYPYWLCYAAGILDNSGHEVQIIDAAPKNLTLDAIEGQICPHPDIIVLDTSTASMDNDLQTLGSLKQKFPAAFYVLVGSHVTALAQKILEHEPGINAIIRGEYDHALRDLVNARAGNRPWQDIRGLSYIRDNSICHNPDYPYIENLDTLPLVSQQYKKFLDVRDYYFAAADYPMIMIITGRGCPFKCFYCVYPQTVHGRAYRYRSPDNVVREFKYIVDNFPDVKEVVIEDDTFTVHPKRVRDICELLLTQGIKIKWSCNARAHLDLHTMQVMKKAGCRLLIAGYESGSQTLLDRMAKNLTLEQSLAFSKNARKAGVLVHGCFMLGCPGETSETIKQTYSFAKKLGCDSAQFYPLFVYPGTEAYTWAKQEGYLKTEDFSQWLDLDGRHRCVIDLPGLAGKDLTQISERLTLKYHTRIFFILYKFKQLFINPVEFLRTMRSGIKYFARLFVHVCLTRTQ
ncbi:MAG: radical SAM protein [Deltaproteobacteria bacterium]|nr:radical SAM protein [Deltaproteobacteria bacterium]